MADTDQTPDPAASALAGQIVDKIAAGQHYNLSDEDHEKAKASLAGIDQTFLGKYLEVLNAWYADGKPLQDIYLQKLATEAIAQGADPANSDELTKAQQAFVSLNNFLKQKSQPPTAPSQQGQQGADAPAGQAAAAPAAPTAPSAPDGAQQTGSAAAPANPAPPPPPDDLADAKSYGGFKVGSADINDLSPADRQAFVKDGQDYLAYLHEHPGTTEVLKIAGHVSATGDPEIEFNGQHMRLSSARAEAVKAYLVAQGVPAEKIETRGYGADRLIDPTKDKENDQNRGVRISRGQPDHSVSVSPALVAAPLAAAFLARQQRPTPEEAAREQARVTEERAREAEAKAKEARKAANEAREKADKASRWRKNQLERTARAAEAKATAAEKLATDARTTADAAQKKLESFRPASEPAAAAPAEGSAGTGVKPPEPPAAPSGPPATASAPPKTPEPTAAAPKPAATAGAPPVEPPTAAPTPAAAPPAPPEPPAAVPSAAAPAETQPQPPAPGAAAAPEPAAPHVPDAAAGTVPAAPAPPPAAAPPVATAPATAPAPVEPPSPAPTPAAGTAPAAPDPLPAAAPPAATAPATAPAPVEPPSPAPTPAAGTAPAAPDPLPAAAPKPAASAAPPAAAPAPANGSAGTGATAPAEAPRPPVAAVAAPVEPPPVAAPPPAAVPSAAAPASSAPTPNPGAATPVAPDPLAATGSPAAPAGASAPSAPAAASASPAAPAAPSTAVAPDPLAAAPAPSAPTAPTADPPRIVADKPASVRVSDSAASGLGDAIGKSVGVGAIALGGINTFKDLQDGRYGDAAFDGTTTATVGAMMTRPGAAAVEQVARGSVRLTAATARGVVAVGTLGLISATPTGAPAASVMAKTVQAAAAGQAAAASATGVTAAAGSSAVTTAAGGAAAGQVAADAGKGAAASAASAGAKAGAEGLGEGAAELGVRGLGEQIPLAGALVAGAFVLKDVGEELWSGHYTRAGTTFVAGVPEIGGGFFGFIGFGLGQAGHQAVTETFRSTGVVSAADVPADAPAVALAKSAWSYFSDHAATRDAALDNNAARLHPVMALAEKAIANQDGLRTVPAAATVILAARNLRTQVGAAAHQADMAAAVSKFANALADAINPVKHGSESDEHFQMRQQAATALAALYKDDMKEMTPTQFADKLRQDAVAFAESRPSVPPPDPAGSGDAVPPKSDPKPDAAAKNDKICTVANPSGRRGALRIANAASLPVEGDPAATIRLRPSDPPAIIVPDTKTLPPAPVRTAAGGVVVGGI